MGSWVQRSEADGFDTYVNDLLNQYPSGLLELALVENLVQKTGLAIPMQKGVAFFSRCPRMHQAVARRNCVWICIAGLYACSVCQHHRTRSADSVFIG